MRADLQDAVVLAQELRPLKAWRVSVPNGDYCLIAFAPTRNKAKAACVRGQPEDWAYTDMRTTRVQRLDAFCDVERVCWSNDELPCGCPDYWDGEDDCE